MQERPKAGSQAGVQERAQAGVQECSQAGSQAGVQERAQTGNSNYFPCLLISTSLLF